MDYHIFEGVEDKVNCAATAVVIFTSPASSGDSLDDLLNYYSRGAGTSESYEGSSCTHDRQAPCRQGSSY